MKIDTDNIVSISDVNESFSKLIRLVDEKGTVIISKNNVPRYVLLDYSLLRKGEVVANDVDVDSVASRILTKHIKAFEELAK